MINALPSSVSILCVVWHYVHKDKELVAAHCSCKGKYAQTHLHIGTLAAQAVHNGHTKIIGSTVLHKVHSVSIGTAAAPVVHKDHT